MAELKTVVSHAEITPTHRFVKQLDVDHKLLRCYTQNIDSLELRLEMSSDLGDKQAARIVQLHGDLDNVICTLCQTTFPFDDPRQVQFRGGTPPPCPECETMQTVRNVAGKRALTIGTLRPNIVLYNEHHSRGDEIAGLTAYDLKRRPDMLIIMGTSLKVVGFKRLVKDLAKSVHELRNGLVVFINNTEVGKEWDDVIDVHIMGRTDNVVARLDEEVRRIQIAADQRRVKRQAGQNVESVLPMLGKRSADAADEADTPPPKKAKLHHQPRSLENEEGGNLAVDIVGKSEVSLSPPPPLVMEDTTATDTDSSTAACSQPPTRRRPARTVAFKRAPATAKAAPPKRAPARKLTAKASKPRAKPSASQPSLTTFSGIRVVKRRQTNNSMCSELLSLPGDPPVKSAIVTLRRGRNAAA
ncbi:hypothetical protein HKX48_007392 [Thoreauomyces humboldtii]|nr:hypothetical protein HKX48_007392 [Thoreauomyces humboldtii]